MGSTRRCNIEVVCLSKDELKLRAITKNDKKFLISVLSVVVVELHGSVISFSTIH